MPGTQLKIEGSRKARTTVVLAHGAGESCDSAFLRYFADGLVERGFRVARFDFPYMAERATTGRKRPPDRLPVLIETWHDVLAQLSKYDRIVIGGKSMGGRIASMVADEAQVGALVCLGYPFHPAGKPDRLRIEHLQTLATPTLILQGERDPFGSRDEVEAFTLSDAIQIHWIPDGDHSFSTGRGSERTVEQNLKNAARALDRFLFELWPDATSHGPL